MKKLTPEAAGTQAASWMDIELNKQLALETNPTRKQLTKILYLRQKKAVACLGLVKNEELAKKTKPNVREQEPWLQILLHPLGNLLLPVLVLVLAIFKLNILTAIASVLMLVRAVMMLLFKPQNAPEEPQQAVPFVEDTDLDAFLRELRRTIGIDVDSIMNQFTAANVKELKGTMDDVITAYTALYEAGVDAPDNDSLSYPLTMLAASLRRAGLDVVHYAPENAAMFEVMDVEYSSMERTPAIVHHDNGVIVKKGLYLNDIR